MDKYFLIEHDRHGKVPTRITEYDQFEDAEKRLFKLDLDQIEELNACLDAGKPVRMEYVVICSQSVESVKHTHGRYFWGDYEVLASVEVRYVNGEMGDDAISTTTSEVTSVPATAR